MWIYSILGSVYFGGCSNLQANEVHGKVFHMGEDPEIPEGPKKPRGPRDQRHRQQSQIVFSDRFLGICVKISKESDSINTKLMQWRCLVEALLLEGGVVPGPGDHRLAENAAIWLFSRELGYHPKIQKSMI